MVTATVCPPSSREQSPWTLPQSPFKCSRFTGDGLAIGDGGFGLGGGGDGDGGEGLSGGGDGGAGGCESGNGGRPVMMSAVSSKPLRSALARVASVKSMVEGP